MNSISPVAACMLLALSWLASASSEASHTLWYSQPALRDFYEALPIGNGRLGAMIHGYTDKELIRLNEESIWSGGPMDKIPTTALDALEPLREQILDGRLTEADQNWVANFTPEYDDMRRYQPAGELRLDFNHTLNETSGYRHSLDVSNGLSSLSYVFGGVEYTREAFGNAPKNVLAFRFSCNSSGSLSLDVSLSRDRNVTELTADAAGRILKLHGTGEEDATYRFVSQAQVLLSDGVGDIVSNGTALHIRNATDVCIIYTAETAFRHPDATMEQLETIVDGQLETAQEAGYEAIQHEAVEDYKQYYDRTSIDFGTSQEIGTKDTIARLDNWKRGSNITTDPELMALQFNVGKYLLIQSSRPGSLPANLQGIWNRDFGPPWDSKFTINVNLEMNYWPAQPLNLPEIAEPVVDFLDRLAVTGSEVAKGMYGADGWCCHHNTDITGDCTPFHAITIAAPYPLGGAWLAFEAIEYFRFTGDTTYARDRILPILKGAMDFIYSWATGRDGWWITNPSCSPENSYYIPENMTVAGETTGIDAGAMNDRAIMWEVMSGFLEISEALDSDEGVDRARSFRDKIQPPVAGSFGQLLEYSREYRENQPGHRHFSPLVCAHPGTWVTPLETPEYADMAYKLLRHRMDNGGGGNSWAVTWASLLHARLFDATNALKYAMELLSRWVHNNLFSRNGSYFQIDGNSGFTAAIVEMFLQSHAGVVHLGPAIPPASQGLSSGSFRGWIARGGFEVDMTWSNGVVVQAEITSLLGNPLRVRVGEGSAFIADGVIAGVDPINTSKGQKISISLF
ncbi:Alpha-L-fucosidase 2 [Colletotrichum siamense]|uniref:Alpha-L-fucosidase 2 n=1 Tax=Colletotrichum siamense TaxID=690259 RepID=A0A9P5BLQ9_COLSI|nr:Alpha-L-fucosidase 2 [Colletotrichum siamense]KAF4843788.1 Alpha-L-fucosidase 2 [Colletotrichum siamense]